MTELEERPTVAGFMAAAKTPRPAAVRGNTAWAQWYAGVHQSKWEAYAARAPRSLQRHLGPSEIGSICDRQVAGKMAQQPTTNHVTDPWPSIQGTALHTYAVDVYQYDNEINGLRWLTETGVVPRVLPANPGTGDLYDGDAYCYSANDHKFLGAASLARVKSPEGPPRKYVVQLLLYADGWRAAGFRVDRVALLAYPRHEKSLDGLYVWERWHTPADDELLAEVVEQTEYRKAWARAIITGAAKLEDVPTAPDSEECYFCPFWRPQSAHDGGPGCPGHVNTK